MDLIDKRCKRAIAIVLSVKEREADPFLTPEAQARLRKVILDQFHELADLASDVVDSMNGGLVLNELFLERLEEIYRSRNETT